MTSRFSLMLSAEVGQGFLESCLETEASPDRLLLRTSTVGISKLQEGWDFLSTRSYWFRCGNKIAIL